ncbi:MAG TPA: right-handed parallel beta-helix repeat-containing protein [Nannocystis sp.]
MLPVFLLTLAATIDIYPGDDLFGAMQALQAGDELVIHEGTYDVPGFVNIVLAGTADAPITIRGAEGEVAVIQGIPSQNAINIEGTYYTLRDLEIVGGSHGVRVGTSAHATFENLVIHHTGDVGISCNRPMHSYEDITIRRVHIHDTGQAGHPGECMYLGCNDGACKVWDSTIEWNLCHDTLAGGQGDGIELKTGSYNTVIRHNVIYNVKYPGITAYGTQGMAPNTIEGNVVWSVADNGIQLVGDAIVRNNLVFDVGASGIAAKPSQGEVVKDLTVVHNTVVGAGDTCFRGNQLPGGGGGIVVANNAFYCEGTSAIKLPDGPGQAIFAANAVVGAVSGLQGGTIDGEGLGAFVDAAAKNVYPAQGSPLVDAADAQYAPAEDFNCLPRAGAHEIGAYDVSTPDNPGWPVQPDFKQCAGGETGGETDSDGTTGEGTTGDGTTGTASEGTSSTGGTSGAPTTGDAPGSSGDVGTGAGTGTGMSPTTGSSGQGSADSTGESGDPATASAGETGGQGTEEGCGCRGGGGGGLWALILAAGWGRRPREPRRGPRAA